MLIIKEYYTKWIITGIWEKRSVCEKRSQAFLGSSIRYTMQAMARDDTEFHILTVQAMARDDTHFHILTVQNVRNFFPPWAKRKASKRKTYECLDNMCICLPKYRNECVYYVLWSKQLQIESNRGTQIKYKYSNRDYGTFPV